MTSPPEPAHATRTRLWRCLPLSLFGRFAQRALGSFGLELSLRLPIALLLCLERTQSALARTLGVQVGQVAAPFEGRAML